jgi:hypothetical protein
MSVAPMGLYPFEWVEVTSLISMDVTVEHYDRLGLPKDAWIELQPPMRRTVRRYSKALRDLKPPRQDIAGLQLELANSHLAHLRQTTGSVLFERYLAFLYGVYASHAVTEKWYGSLFVLRSWAGAYSRRHTDSIGFRNPDYILGQFHRWASISEDEIAFRESRSKPLSSWDQRVFLLRSYCMEPERVRQVNDRIGPALLRDPLSTLIESVEYRRFQDFWRRCRPEWDAVEMMRIRAKVAALFPGGDLGVLD